jgi:AAA domain
MSDYHSPENDAWRASIAAYNREHRPVSTKKSTAEIRSLQSGARLDAENEPRIKLIPFDEIKLGTEPRYLVKGVIPREGLTVVWGPPKCGKSFWMYDLSMHVSLGWQYRDRRVQQGAVVYCAFEGQIGIQARVEAFRQTFPIETTEPVPFYLQPMTLDLVRDHAELMAAVRRQLGITAPALVVLDTLNRSLRGSENDSEDMAAYIAAADAIRLTFGCAVVVIHHCGIDGTRPRGSTALTGAVDAQLSVKRDASDRVIVEVEVGKDQDGEPITSCVIEAVDVAPILAVSQERLTPNQRTMFRILHAAGPSGLILEDWYEQARREGIGTNRRATLGDLRAALHAKGLITQTMNGWAVKQPT